jgi:hypothetical protein
VLYFQWTDIPVDNEASVVTSSIEHLLG